MTSRCRESPPERSPSPPRRGPVQSDHREGLAVASGDKRWSAEELQLSGALLPGETWGDHIDRIDPLELEEGRAHKDEGNIQSSEVENRPHFRSESDACPTHRLRDLSRDESPCGAEEQPAPPRLEVPEEVLRKINTARNAVDKILEHKAQATLYLQDLEDHRRLGSVPEHLRPKTVSNTALEAGLFGLQDKWERFHQDLALKLRDAQIEHYHTLIGRAEDRILGIKVELVQELSEFVRDPLLREDSVKLAYIKLDNIVNKPRKPKPASPQVTRKVIKSANTTPRNSPQLARKNTPRQSDATPPASPLLPRRTMSPLPPMSPPPSPQMPRRSPAMFRSQNEGALTIPRARASPEGSPTLTRRPSPEAGMSPPPRGGPWGLMQQVAARARPRVNAGHLQFLPFNMF
ncbi:Hypp5702 [Branchiostoma lanceolatum]|uniref:Hypp5702 protein n=1 Tax=Branchiostoma lanceolatum TaxID=7740 RepID=A0A8J9VRB2_BRALA|nr:Hypp5702 [Branchiostoma lanceolatum]